MHDSSANIRSISLVKSLVYRFSNVSLDSKTTPAKETPGKRMRRVNTTAGGTNGHQNTFLYATMTSRYKKGQQDNRYSSGISSNSENGDSDCDKQIDKIEHLMKELCDTEQKYITTLTDAQMYLNYLQMTMVTTNNPDVKEMENYVNDIIKQHKDFHMDLNLINNYIQPTESIGRLFLKYKSVLFDLYPELTKYKVRLEQVLCQQGVKDLLLIKYKEFDDKLGFPSHLLTIVQRLPKYKLLLIRLEKLFKEKYEENDRKLQEAVLKLQEARKMLDETIKLGEDYITIDSIKMPKEDLFQYGKIRLIGRFDSPTLKKVLLLLFEKKIVIALMRGKLDEELVYAEELKLNSLGINAYEMDPLKIDLIDYSKMNFDKPFTVQLIAENTVKKQEWVSKLNNELWQQAKKIKETLSKKNRIRIFNEMGRRNGGNNCIFKS